MTNVKGRAALTAALGVVVGLASHGALADVRIVSVTNFGGIAGMGASNITDNSYLRGHNKRVESNVQFTGAILGALQKWKHGDKGSNGISIYRLDENRKYILDADSKTYRVEPIYTPPQPSAEGSSSGAPDNSGGQKDNDVRIVKNEFNVKDTGKSQVFNGFQAHEYLLTWDLETENTKTHERSRSLMTTDLWNSDDARFETARKDQAAYNLAYSQLMHVPMPSDMAKQYGFVQLSYLTTKDVRPFMDKLSKLKGFPVVTDVQWQAGCIANCSGSDQGTSGDQQNSDSSAALGNLLGSLLSKHASQNPQSGAQKPSDGLSTIFHSHTEVKSIDTNSQPVSLFEVPSGYTKQ
ncbi:MAG: hypothetical protein KGK44_08610 [Gammaproteobacteria bacterium]|nr:hypothetical protein [Gammaproteobacteria bacterium]